MSSNYKYKGKPLDEVAATYNPKNHYYINNKLADIETFKLSDFNYAGSDTENDFIKCTDKIANGIWGNMPIYDIYKKDGESIKFTDIRSVIFSGLKHDNADANEVPISSSHNADRINFLIYYDANNDTIKYKEYEIINGVEYILNKHDVDTKNNRFIHIIDVVSKGGKGFPGNMGTYNDSGITYSAYTGGKGGGSSGFCSIMFDVSKSKIRAYHSPKNRMEIEFAFYSNPIRYFYIYIYDGYGSTYTESTAGKIYFKSDLIYNNIETQLTNDNISIINSYLKDHNIMILCFENGKDGGRGAYYNTYWNGNNEDSYPGSAFPSKTFSYSDNIHYNTISRVGGGAYSKYVLYGNESIDGSSMYRIYQPGGGGGSSFFSDGGHGAGLKSEISGLLPATAGGYGSGGGGGCSYDNSDNIKAGGNGGAYKIEIYAESIDGKIFKF